jgi:His-Xaa-Ser system radical SAM maturase HxsB
MAELMTPFRFRDLGDDASLIVNEVGDFKLFDSDIVSRLFDETLTEEDHSRLRDMHILLEDEKHWRLTALASRAQNRISKMSGKLSYMLIIPTLRCDLACTYCQVSRANENAEGFDMKPEHLDFLESFWTDHAGPKMKIEFQGGEPTLRADLVREIMDRATRHFDQVEFAICTNLMNLTPEAKDVISDPRMHVSTSIDGPTTMMATNRTGTTERADNFFRNLRYILDTYGSAKVSALPTIPEEAYGHINEIIDVYLELGFTSIFLRPVNYLGFARKNHASSLDSTDRWNRAYFQALERIMEINKTQFFEEFYSSMIFQKIIGAGATNYVDCRSPNRYFEDYCVVNFDGGIYPTDEARMLSRTRQVDLKIGELGGVIDLEKLSALNFSAMNEVHPDCIHCAYGPFCGIDLVDDLSRYGRIDSPKHETAFCKRHLDLFDLLFTKIKERDRTWLDPLMSWAYRKDGSHAPFEVLYD